MRISYELGLIAELLIVFGSLAQADGNCFKENRGKTTLKSNCSGSAMFAVEKKELVMQVVDSTSVRDVSKDLTITFGNCLIPLVYQSKTIPSEVTIGSAPSRLPLIVFVQTKGLNCSTVKSKAFSFMPCQIPVNFEELDDGTFKIEVKYAGDASKVADFFVIFDAPLFHPPHESARVDTAWWLCLVGVVTGVLLFIVGSLVAVFCCLKKKKGKRASTKQKNGKPAVQPATPKQVVVEPTQADEESKKTTVAVPEKDDLRTAKETQAVEQPKLRPRWFKLTLQRLRINNGLKAPSKGNATMEDVESDWDGTLELPEKQTKSKRDAKKAAKLKAKEEKAAAKLKPGGKKTTTKEGPTVEFQGQTVNMFANAKPDAGEKN